MTYEVFILPSAEKELQRLPKNYLQAIARSIDALGRQPRPRGVQ